MTKITVDADSKAKFPTIFKNLKMRKLDKRHVNTPYSDKKKKTPRLKRVRKITTYRERQWLSEEKLVIQIRDENKMMNKEKTESRRVQRKNNKFILFK